MPGMTPGVTILATVPESGEPVAIAILFVVSVALIVFLAWFPEYWNSKVTPGYIICSLVAIFLLAFCAGTLVPQVHGTYYIAEVDPDVPYVQFTDSYNVRDSYGVIYFLEEKGGGK